MPKKTTRSSVLRNPIARYLTAICAVFVSAPGTSVWSSSRVWSPPLSWWVSGVGWCIATRSRWALWSHSFCCCPACLTRCNSCPSCTTACSQLRLHCINCLPSSTPLPKLTRRLMLLHCRIVVTSWSTGWASPMPPALRQRCKTLISRCVMANELHSLGRLVQARALWPN